MEFDVPQKDILVDIPMTITRGVVSYDLCIARKDRIDARKFWTQSGQGKDEDTKTATLQRLKQISIIAELKTASSATTRKELKNDLLKMCGAVKFLERNGAVEFPDCFLVVFDPEGALPVRGAYSDMKRLWPEGVPEPRILIGP